MSGTLVVCATPIGNLRDASPHLRDVLAEVDVVYAEDTRRTRKLLRHLDVEVPVRSFFVGNERRRFAELRDRLVRGETVAVVTDAGTPGVSDPGPAAVRAARAADATVTVVPGPSAVTAALAVSGISADRFVFEGFLPRSGAAREERLATIAREPRAVVLFSATNRVGDDLADLLEACGPDREVVVARELTKVHEEVWHGTLGAANERWADPANARGEFTLVVAPAGKGETPLDEALDDVAAEMAGGARLSEAVRSVADATGVSRRALYRAALERRRRGD